MKGARRMMKMFLQSGLVAVLLLGLVWGAANADQVADFAKEPGIRIDVGPPGSFDNPRASYPDIVSLPRGGFRMYYRGTDLTTFLILSAVSLDGLAWTKEEGVRLAPESTEWLSEPEVIQLEDGTYRMYYSAKPGRWVILSAVSSDGINGPSPFCN